MNNNTNSETITEGIRINVIPSFMPEHSHPDKSEFFFKYKIRITNESDEPVQLLKRFWLIINSDGDEEKVDGEGVVGYTPYLLPGEFFEYESFCGLDTSWGTMEGYYLMKKENGEEFKALIDRFYLADVLLV